MPKRTLAGSLLWQTMTPLLPAIVLALGSGILLVRSVYHQVQIGGGIYEACTDPAANPESCARTVVVDPLRTVDVPVPWEQLAVLGGGTVLAVLLVAGAGVLLLRGSTDLGELRVR